MPCAATSSVTVLSRASKGSAGARLNGRDQAAGPEPAVFRILHVITDRDRRGAQVYATDLSEGLTQLGHVSHVVALAPGRHGDLLPVDALGPGERSPTTLRHLRRRAADYDVVVAHGSSTLFACAIGLFGSRVPFVYRQIGDPLFWASSWSRRLRVAALVRRAAAVVTLSPGVETVFRTHYRLRADATCVIPNAVPGRAFAPARPGERAHSRASLGLPTEHTLVVYIGALAPEKGVDLVIEAVARTSAHLAVVGSGPEAPRLRALADRVAPGRVHFTGPLDQPAQALRAADLLVLASRGGESMPAVLIEGGLCGLACISTPIGAIPEVVIDGVSGLIVPAGQLEPLVDAVTTLVDDPERRAAFGEAARQHCQQMFTIEATAPAWHQLLDRVCHRPR